MSVAFDRTVTLDALTQEQCEQVRCWRNEESTLATLRTPFRLTAVQQTMFYHDVVCDPTAPHRYWGAHSNGMFVGMGGLTNIEWENRLAEISLILHPQMRGKGYGFDAVAAILREGFERMGLATIVGECYVINTGGMDFWQKVIERYHAQTAILPRRKFWNGTLSPSLYFTISDEMWFKRKGLFTDPVNS